MEGFNKKGILINNRVFKKGLILRTIVGMVLMGVVTVLPSTISAKQQVPKSAVFDLTDQATELIRNKKLHNGTVLQSFAFDNKNKHIYVVQLMEGGQRLRGENKKVSGETRSSNGDLTLTKLDMKGNKLGYMFLKGFGHGVQIGVETVGITPYLWTETDSKAGWGTQLARFKFRNGAVLTPNSSAVEKHRLIEGANRTTVNIDPINKLLTMRYQLGGSFRFGVYDLDDVKQGKYTPLADVPQPPMGIFQGFASYGGYLYLLDGSAYGNNGSVKPNGNTYITSVDLNTGKVVERKLFKGGNNLTFREPEGLAIRIPDLKHPNKAHLSVGFASNSSPKRLSNIYYVDKLVPGKSK
ncbi:hypothetical protein [Fredinandcohnia quinoae]|uniref:P68 RBP/TagC-like beta-propeller domain-containing protein n=1 Tax=Fredinandcohnia quinoae TaxID=2918902 RepID=A0AAW5E521_9BACI|nr:hypothetical protein [Fredinandcohnia sp. SECRCQ15]MCH1625939.1 hypothetical protein [Fredinandcohnia sp. SECRCQ15]